MTIIQVTSFINQRFGVLILRRELTISRHARVNNIIYYIISCEKMHRQNLERVK